MFQQSFIRSESGTRRPAQLPACDLLFKDQMLGADFYQLMMVGRFECRGLAWLTGGRPNDRILRLRQNLTGLVDPGQGIGAFCCAHIYKRATLLVRCRLFRRKHH